MDACVELSGTNEECCVRLGLLRLCKSEDTLLSDDFIQERLHHLYNKAGDYDIGHRTLYKVNQ